MDPHRRGTAVAVREAANRVASRVETGLIFVQVQPCDFGNAAWLESFRPTPMNWDPCEELSAALGSALHVCFEVPNALACAWLHIARLNFSACNPSVLLLSIVLCSSISSSLCMLCLETASQAEAKSCLGKLPV